jgi:hypothetical protein
MATQQIPDNVLNAAENIQLRDLLQSPTFRPWIVSGINNAVRSAFMTEDEADEDDQYLQFKLNQMMRAIPFDIRREYFGETARMVRERRNHYVPREQARA